MKKMQKVYCSEECIELDGNDPTSADVVEHEGAAYCRYCDGLLEEFYPWYVLGAR